MKKKDDMDQNKYNVIEECTKATEKIWKWTLWFLVLATSILGLMWWKWR